VSSPQSVEAPPAELRAAFEAAGQGHVFAYWEGLAGAERDALRAQAERLAPGLASLCAQRRACLEKLAAPDGASLEPVAAEALPERGGDPERRAEAARLGRELLEAGRVAVFVVAGGQGTRLGFDGPKGSFPVGPATHRSLFEIQAQKIRGLRRRCGRPVPWYVMTSDATDAATRRFFDEHDFFGLPREDVSIFAQAMIPAFDFDGRLLLETPSHIFESPNGHGGSLTALADSGALDDMAKRGIDTVFYYQVDNPLVRIGDPVYLGLHAMAGAEMSCKVVRKTDPMEKVGVVARSDGRVGVVEYTELQDAERLRRDEAGELVYWAGNVGIHVLDREFVARVAAEAETLLPLHPSAKKIPTLDERGEPVTPQAPNGHKLERFVFDALAAAESVVVCEARAAEEFAPIKNATGPDSPETARAALLAEYRRWLAAAGVEPPDLPFELDHARIDDADEARALGSREAVGRAIRTAPQAPERSE